MGLVCPPFALGERTFMIPSKGPVAKLRIWHSLSAFSPQLRPCPHTLSLLLFHTCPSHSPAPLLRLSGPRGQGQPALKQPVDVFPGTQMGQGSQRVMVSVMGQCGFCGGIAMAMGNASCRTPRYGAKVLAPPGMRDLVEEWGGG